MHSRCSSFSSRTCSRAPKDDYPVLSTLLQAVALPGAARPPRSRRPAPRGRHPRRPRQSRGVRGQFRQEAARPRQFAFQVVGLPQAVVQPRLVGRDLYRAAERCVSCSRTAASSRASVPPTPEARVPRRRPAPTPPTAPPAAFELARLGIQRLRELVVFAQPQGDAKFFQPGRVFLAALGLGHLQLHRS